MNNRNEEEADYLEVWSEDDCSVSDDYMVEKVLWQPYHRHSCEAQGCDGSSPDSNKSKDEAEDESKKTGNKELGKEDTKRDQPIGDHQGNKDKAEAAKVQTRIWQLFKCTINTAERSIETI